MTYKYVFDPVAATEYEDAFNWYEAKSEIAADNLLLAVESALIAICIDPFRYRNSYKNFRELALKKYPYHLIYFIDEDNKVITIVSIYHSKRHPKGKYHKSSNSPKE